MSNLQQMAKTVAYIQEHGYDTEDDLKAAFDEAQAQTTEMRKTLRSTEKKLREVNEQIHYTGQYLANKSVYREFLTCKNKKKFRLEHQTEITLYETARKILKEHSEDGKLPSMKLLKAEKEKLAARKAASTKHTETSGNMKRNCILSRQTSTHFWGKTAPGRQRRNEKVHAPKSLPYIRRPTEIFLYSVGLSCVSFFSCSIFLIST